MTHKKLLQEVLREARLQARLTGVKLNIAGKIAKALGEELDPESASAIVDGWPEWKQNLLGKHEPKPLSNEELEYLETHGPVPLSDTAYRRMLTRVNYKPVRQCDRCKTKAPLLGGLCKGCIIEQGCNHPKELVETKVWATGTYFYCGVCGAEVG
jgi:hypothetical protein